MDIYGQFILSTTGGATKVELKKALSKVNSARVISTAWTSLKSQWDGENTR